MSLQQPSAATAQPAIPQQGSAVAYPHGSYAKGVTLCLVSAIICGGMFPVMTSALRHVDPFTFTSLRYLIAGSAFLVLLRIREGAAAFQLKGEPIILAWFVGSIGFCGFGSFAFLGQQLAGRDGALTTSVMMATQPMMGLLVNSLVRRIMPPLYTFLFILMSFSGVVLVVTKGDIPALLREPQHYAANGLIIVGALCWVIYTFSASYFKNWSALKYTAMTTWLGLTTIIGLNILLLAFHAVPTPSRANLIAIIPNLLYMGPVAGFVMILFWNMGNKILTPLNGVLFMDVVPVTAFIVSAITGVIPAHMQIAGAGLTGAALILNNLYLRHRALRVAAKQ